MLAGRVRRPGAGPPACRGQLQLEVSFLGNLPPDTKDAHTLRFLTGMAGGTRWKVWALLGALLALVVLDEVLDARSGSQPAAPVGGGAGGDLPSRPPAVALVVQPPPAAGADRRAEPDKLVLDRLDGPPGEPTAWANLTYQHCDAHPLQACAQLPDYFEAHTVSRSHLFALERDARIIKMSNTWSRLEYPKNQEFWVTTWRGSPESDDGHVRGVGTRTANSFTLNGWIVSGSENVTDGDLCDGHVTTPSRCVAAIAGVERHSPYYHSGSGYYYPSGFRVTRLGYKVEPRIAGGTIVLTCEFGMGTSTGGLPGQKGSCTGIYNWTTPTEDILYVDDRNRRQEPIDPRTKTRAKYWEFPNMRDHVLDKCFRVLNAQDIEDMRSHYEDMRSVEREHKKHMKEAYMRKKGYMRKRKAPRLAEGADPVREPAAQMPGPAPGAAEAAASTEKGWWEKYKVGDLWTMDCPKSEDLVPGQGQGH